MYHTIVLQYIIQLYGIVYDYICFYLLDLLMIAPTLPNQQLVTLVFIMILSFFSELVKMPTSSLDAHFLFAEHV